MKFHIGKELRIVLITTLIAVVITNPISIMVTNVINGPSPGLAVNSVGFAKDLDTKIVISDEILHRLSGVLYAVDVGKYTDYKTLYGLYNRIESNAKELDVAIEQAGLWQKSLLNDQSAFLSTDQILNSPFINFGTMRDVSMLILSDDAVAIRAPTAIEVINKRKENAVPFFVQNGYVGFRLKSQDIVLTNLKRSTVRQNLYVNSILLSYVYGERKNIIYYTKLFIDNASSYVLKYQEIAKEVREILLKNAQLEVLLTVYNNGHSAVIFSPYFVLRIEHESYAKAPIGLVVVQDDKPGTDAIQKMMGSAMDKYVSQMLRSFDTNEYSSSLQIDQQQFMTGSELFADITSTSQISLQPGESRALRLSGLENEISGEELYKLYQSNLLKCQIAGITINGWIYKSPNASFGQNAAGNAIDSLMKVR